LYTTSNPIYLDHAATTPVRPEVLESMQPLLSDNFGNPSSPHRWGRKASQTLWEARERVAGVIEAKPTEIYFTRGGTESDNLAILGSCIDKCVDGVFPELVVSSVEHHAVLDAAKAAVRVGHAREVHTLELFPDGTLDLEPLERAVLAGCCIASVMWVNNETGMHLPLESVAEIMRAPQASSKHLSPRLHTDAVQALGKTRVSVAEVPVDLLSLTGHKIYGPKGTGALFVRTGVQVAPLLAGGGQERGMRPGTEDVAGAVGLATAVELAEAERKELSERLGHIRDRFEERILEDCPGSSINGGAAPRVGTISSIHLPNSNGQSLVFGLDMEGVACSGGSACSSGSSGSHVIDALYPGRGGATLRFSLGRKTTIEDMELAASAVARVLAMHHGSRV